MYRDQSGEFVCGFWGLKATKTLVLTLRSILRHYGNHVNVFPHAHHYPILLLLLSFSSEIVINETTSFT